MGGHGLWETRDHSRYIYLTSVLHQQVNSSFGFISFKSYCEVFCPVLACRVHRFVIITPGLCSQSDGRFSSTEANYTRLFRSSVLANPGAGTAQRHIHI